MAQIKLMKCTLDALKPREAAYIAFDDDVPGFGVRVMPSGTKTFVVEYRPNGGGRGVSKRRLTIGRYGPITPEKARTAAKETLAKVRLGGDPAAAKAEQRAAVTVSTLIDVFITRHVEPKCKPSTVSAHRGALEHLRKAYGATKAENLKRPQIGLLHAQMRTDRLERIAFLL